MLDTDETTEHVAHVEKFRDLGLCTDVRRGRFVTQRNWRSVKRRASEITCPQCRLLIAVVKANGFQHLFTQHHELVQAIREVLK